MLIGDHCLAAFWHVVELWLAYSCPDVVCGLKSFVLLSQEKNHVGPEAVEAARDLAVLKLQDMYEVVTRDMMTDAMRYIPCDIHLYDSVCQVIYLGLRPKLEVEVQFYGCLCQGRVGVESWSTGTRTRQNLRALFG